VYRSLPNLAIDRLAELEAASPVPLVLHGGSGTPEPQLRAAVTHGICKVNYYADCRIAMAQGLRQTAQALVREDPLPRELFGQIKKGVCQFVAAKIQMLGAAGRAWSEATRV
jgi:fructose-bisphosphate aldolase class II